MNDLDRMINSLNLLNEIELEVLTEACQSRVEEKKKARRETLRKELMENLQRAISAILNNNFSLSIKNTDCDPNYDAYDEVFFDPEETFSIEMRDYK